MNATDYSVLIIWSKEDEAFLAQVLVLPGCVADGATREEALANVLGVQAGGAPIAVLNEGISGAGVLSDRMGV